MLHSSTTQSFRQARLSRDARFDGQFFLGVKTTGIFCRPICPARLPKEENVEYFNHAHEAARAGYRPCLRCHPDSAPGSAIWNGVSTTLERAKRLIDNGALEDGSLVDLCTQLGISDRYLRRLFKQHIGISPKGYALFKQCLFAKRLLHQTNLSITDVAFASGFRSIRRFNDCFKKQLSLNPTQLKRTSSTTGNSLKLKLYYRPPYHWQHMQQFLAQRLIPGLEWSDADSYGRTFQWHNTSDQCQGQFTAVHNPEQHCFDVSIEIDNVVLLKSVVNNIRRILDIDADTASIEHYLKEQGFNFLQTGLRLPGTWSLFEAGVRAILGQQISVLAARNLVSAVTEELGEVASDQKRYFPTFEHIAHASFDFIRIPGKRKQTLNLLAQHFLNHENPDKPEDWLTIKGIGPWTVDYAKMRGLSDPDIYLGGDLGLQKGIRSLGIKAINPDRPAPFRSN